MALLENPSRIIVQKKNLGTASVAEQLPDTAVPYDHEVVILALSTNSGTIYVGNSKADAQDTNKSYPLTAGESIGYKINNVGHLWIRDRKSVV